MTTQPEALRLADALEIFHNPYDKKAAAELRRLHAENEAAHAVGIRQEQELMKCEALLRQALEELDWIVTGRGHDTIEATHAALRAQALEEAAGVCDTLGVHPALNIYNGGPDWYKHGKDCAAAIRALMSVPDGKEQA